MLVSVSSMLVARLKPSTTATAGWLAVCVVNVGGEADGNVVVVEAEAE